MTVVINDNIPELAGMNALPYIEKYANLCPHCKLAQTNVINLKSINDEFEKEYVMFIWDYINNNNLKLFTKKKLMNGLKINHISNGVKQDKALSVLIMLGYLRKDIQVVVDKKGNEKDVNIYVKKVEIKPAICYNTKTDKHIEMDWFGQGIRKRYYNKK